jgi:hypothetical protein
MTQHATAASRSNELLDNVTSASPVQPTAPFLT